MMAGSTTNPALRANVLFLVQNVIGAFIYVARASYGWRIPEEQGLIPVTGEPYIWFAAILPVVAVFFVVNFIWGLLVLHYRQWQIWRFWLPTALIWLAAIAIDFAHH